MKRTISLLCLAAMVNVWQSTANAQTLTHYTTTEGKEWRQSSQKLSGKAAAEPVLTITGNEQGHEFIIHNS